MSDVQPWSRRVYLDRVEYEVALPVEWETLARVYAMCASELGGARSRLPNQITITSRERGRVLVIGFDL